MTDSKSMIDETKAVRDFRRLFERAAANGGEEKLFGRGSLAAALQVIQKSSLVGTDPVFFHLEVPLTGSPRMDLFLEYNCREIKSPVRFAQGDGFGWKPFLAECVNDKNLREYMFNFAFDLSEGKKQPNIYLIPLFKDANCDYIPAMLGRMGIPERRERLMEAFAAAPAGWKPYYAGFLDMRPDSPIRFGFQIARERMEAYAEDVAIMKRDLSVYCAIPMGTTMTEQLALLAGEKRPCDIDLNIYPDGTFGEGFGITLDPDIKFRDVRRPEETMASGVMKHLLSMATEWGLADERQEQIGKACYAVGRLVKDGADRVMVADVVKPYVIKIRFQKDGACLAKIYLTALSRELERYSCEDGKK